MSQPAPVSAVLPACGFKEWSMVCEALGHGAQSVILRKGGIHEGKGGFWWRHDRFFLFPTHFHEQDMQFPWQPAGPAPEDSSPDPALPGTEPAVHTVRYFAELESKYQITDWETVRRLQPFHFWTENTLRERFDYSENTGLSLAFLRVFRLDAPWTFASERRFGGCRSWLDLPPPPGAALLTPVLDDSTHRSRRQEILGILGESVPAVQA